MASPVQSGTAGGHTQSGSTTNADSLSSSTPAGNIVIVRAASIFGGAAARTVSGVVDSASNTWTRRDHTTQGAGPDTSVEIWESVIVNAGTLTITVTFSGSADSNICIDEYDSTYTSYVTGNNNGGTGTSATTGAADPGGTGLALAVVTDLNGVTIAPPGGSYTQTHETESAGTCPINTIDAPGISGSQNPTWTLGASPGGWAAAIATYVSATPASSALSGTVTASIVEADVVAGGKTVIATISNDTLVAASALATIALRGTAQKGSTTNGGNVTLTFDGSPQVGDVAIVFGGHGTTVTTLTAPGTGYTQIYAHTGTAPIWGVWYKQFAGSADASVVCNGGGNAADAVAYGSYVFDGSKLDAAIFDATATSATGSSTNPNCPSITTATAGAWVLALAGSVVNDASPGTVSGYSNQANANATDTSPFTTSGMTKLVAAAGAEDPAAYSSWSTGAWNAVTVALKPKALTPFADARAAIIAGLVSAQSETHGWNADVVPAIPVANVVRTSSTVCTITLPAVATYDITAQETITWTVPGSALSRGVAAISSPTFTIDPGGAPAAPPYIGAMAKQLNSFRMQPVSGGRR